MDSPGSQSSGQLGHLLLTLSPSDSTPTGLLHPTHLAKPPGLLEGTRGHAPASESLLWDTGLNGEVAVETSYPRGLHDIQRFSTVPDQSLDKLLGRTRGKPSVEMGPPAPGQEAPLLWSNASPHATMRLPSDTVSGYLPSDPDNSNSPSRIGTSLRGSFSAFNLPADENMIAERLSFAPPQQDISLDLTRHQSLPEHDLAERSDGFAQYCTPPDVGSIYTYDSQSPSNATDGISPHSGHSHFMSTSLSPNVPGDGPPATDDFFTKVMNGHLASDQYSPGHHASDSASVPISVLSTRGAVGPNTSSSPEKKWLTYLTSVTDNYGLDSGRPDLDLNKNDDHSAIDINYALDLINSQASNSLSATRTRSSSGGKAQLDGAKYTYYSSPVPINIPRYLSPLPSTLVQTPINLMYFHHFLNHTARMLVAHDCGNNPFVSVLPTSMFPLPVSHICC